MDINGLLYIHTHIRTYRWTDRQTQTHTYLIYTYIHTHTYIHRDTYIHTHRNKHLHIHTRTYVHTDTQTYPQKETKTYIHKYIHTYTHTYTHRDRLTHTKTYRHTHIYTYTYKHTHTHIYRHHTYNQMEIFFVYWTVCLHVSVCFSAYIHKETGEWQIHLDGMSDRYDYTTNPSSAHLHPLGYLAFIGHKHKQYRPELQPPHSKCFEQAFQIRKEGRKCFI